MCRFRRIKLERTNRLNKASLEGRNILVVEDDYLIAMGVRDRLAEAGATVLGPAPSVSKALRLLETGSVDAAILDVNLGGEASFPVARVLQATNAPFLFSTGYNSADIPDDWRHVRVMMKPLRLTAVIELLSSMEPPCR